MTPVAFAVILGIATNLGEIMEHVELGKWYATVDCEKCGRGLAFQEAPADRRRPLPLPDKLPLHCHVCGHEGVYCPEQVRYSQGQYKQ